MNTQSRSIGRDQFKNQIRFFNRRYFNPFAMSFAGRPNSFWSVLRHKGRRSGQPYTTPVVAANRNQSIVIPLPYGRQVDWLKNVRAAGEAELIHHGRVYRIAQPEEIALEQGIAAFPGLIQALMRATGTDGFVFFKRCDFAADEQEQYAAFTTAFPFERGAWILAAVAAFLFGISRQFRRQRRRH